LVSFVLPLVVFHCFSAAGNHPRSLTKPKAPARHARIGIRREHAMDSRLKLAVFLFGCQLLLSGAASLDGGRDVPPLSPEGEQVMNDPDTASFCRERAVELGAKLDKAPDSAGYFQWTLGEPLVSVNETWGVVCRIDFKMAGEDVSPRVNRLVLYVDARKMSFMIAIGQSLPALPADAE
jgi:hypothetical protein